MCLCLLAAEQSASARLVGRRPPQNLAAGTHKPIPQQLQVSGRLRQKLMDLLNISGFAEVLKQHSGVNLNHANCNILISTAIYF